MQYIKLPARKAAKETIPKPVKREATTLLERHCIKQGVRITAIRQAIIDALEQASGYLTAEEIYCLANSAEVVVSMSATYTTLKMFSDKQIISRRTFQSKQNYYSKSELGVNDHLVDAKSGRVTPFRNKTLDRLKEEIAQQYGYSATDCRVEFYIRPPESTISVNTSQED